MNQMMPMQAVPVQPMPAPAPRMLYSVDQSMGQGMYQGMTQGVGKEALDAGDIVPVPDQQDDQAAPAAPQAPQLLKFSGAPDDCNNYTNLNGDYLYQGRTAKGAPYYKK